MRILSAISLLLASFLLSGSALAQEVPLEVQSTVNGIETEKQPKTVLEALREGRTLLKQELERQRAEGAKKLSEQPSWATVTLAIWEKETDAISLVTIEKSGRKVKVLTPGNWPISVSYDNRLYSQYSLPASRNATVIGVVYPVAKKLSAKSFQLTPTLYVPFQNEFYRPEVLAAGSDYLSNLIQQAFDDLRAKGIRSKAYPDRLVVDVIDPYLIKSIVVIEHSSHVQLLSDNEPERVLGVFLAKLGINGEEAFDAALSSAGASGLVQFIPSTYALFVKNRPQYELVPDFAAGMADHKNAIKAEVAYLDDALASMPAEQREVYATDKAKAAEFLAAAYNGGITRVKRAIAAYGDAWSTSHKKELAELNALAAKLKKQSTATAKKQRADAVARIATINKASLREETVTYVAKLRRTYGMFTAGMFSTPNAPTGALPVSRPETPRTPDGVAGVICFSDSGCVPAS